MHPATLHVGTFTRSLLLDLARSTGRLERAGLDVRETQVVSSPAQFAALEAGELDIVMTSPDNVLAYRFLTQNPLGHNLPVEIVAAIDRGLGLSLCVAPSVADVAAVRGGSVAVDVPESGFAFVAFALLDAAGLEPGDYTVESLGSTPSRADGPDRGALPGDRSQRRQRAARRGRRLSDREPGRRRRSVPWHGRRGDRELRSRVRGPPCPLRRRPARDVPRDPRRAAGGRGRRGRDAIARPRRGRGTSAPGLPAGSRPGTDPGRHGRRLVDRHPDRSASSLRPTPELDQVADSWPSMVVGRASLGPADAPHD